MRFSIICLTYKRNVLLNEAVCSVLQQTFKDYELIVINDFADQQLVYNHPKVRILNLKTKFKTIGDKRNFGIENALGDIIINLDDDDLFLPEYLNSINNLIGDSDYLYPQRPIIYHNDYDKIYLSPHPLTNTFVYRRETIATFIKYKSQNFDELTPFFIDVQKSKKGKFRAELLKPHLCGYVYRQSIDADKKYSMGEFKTELIEKQDEIIGQIKDNTGVIILNPKWNKDYEAIIKTHCQFPKSKGVSEMEQSLKQSKEENILVKNSWENALKFVESANSRGIVSTALSFIGINNNFGNRVDDKTLLQRKLSCFGDAKNGIQACDKLFIHKEKGAFCGFCGCGTKNVARLDGEGYTKLHYPFLSCPMKRKGFSNEEKSITDGSISIIIPVLNDQDELNKTIKSIRSTTPNSVEIIVIDDKSDIPVVVDDSNVKILRLTERIGVGGTRHLGAELATMPYLLFIDSHMRFTHGWYENAIKRLTTSPENVVWCGTCLGLDETNMDINNPNGVYCGARLSIYEKNENQIFEGKWIDAKPNDDYEITCLMGACYFFHKKWFFYIGGTKSLKMWGSDEPLLSAKTLLAGGTIKLSKSIKIGHKFRTKASYSTNVSYLTYNKLRSIKMLFSDELYDNLKSKIKDDADKVEALKMIEMDSNEIMQEREYYKNIFLHDEKWLFEKLNVTL